MDWRFEARRDTGRHFPWISIPGVASIAYWFKSSKCEDPISGVRDIGAYNGAAGSCLELASKICLSWIYPDNARSMASIRNGPMLICMNSKIVGEKFL